MPRRRELPFDSDRKMMSTFHYRGGTGVTFTKGAPDVVLGRCTHIMVRGQCLPLQPGHVRQIRKAMEKMADEALRTLAIAMRVGNPVQGSVSQGPGSLSPGGVIQEQGLAFLGMVGMRDPARPEAAGAVATFRQAGVETVMITGDHVDTAYAIGRQLGIVQNRQQCMTGQELSRIREEELSERLAQVRVFARVAPEQKVQIVTGFQQAGHIVAMTGDGVNDAPSLKKADIGIAMGASGTDVAKQAADMILTDDNFATIEKAIEEARGTVTDAGLTRGRLEGEMNVLKEQINSAKGSETHLKNRKQTVEAEIAVKNRDKEEILTQKAQIDLQVQELTKTRDEVRGQLETVQGRIEELNSQIEAGKNAIIGELNQRATIKSKLGRYDTMTEQINIRKAELNSRILRAKSDEEAREENIRQLEQNPGIQFHE